MSFEEILFMHIPFTLVQVNPGPGCCSNVVVLLDSAVLFVILLVSVSFVVFFSVFGSSAGSIRTIRVAVIISAIFAGVVSL